MNATVVDITIVRDLEVTVTFDDGAICRFPLPELRQACPCAVCRGRREAGQSPWTGPVEQLRVADAQLIGAWGLGLTWNDGHDTGIYPWDSLRRWFDGEADGIELADARRPDGHTGDAATTLAGGDGAGS